MKRIIVISDMHCGHRTGLTPPAFQEKEFSGSTTKRNKWASLQREMWANYKRLIEKYQPYDVGICLGDMIDGKGAKTGGTEHISVDRNDQSDMAADVCNAVRVYGKKNFAWYGVYGTDYHASSEGGEDWETIAAERAGFEKIGSHEWLDVNGCIIDLKHFIGASSIPYGRFSAPAKDRLWNVLWSQDEWQPKAKLILRGHSHYHAFCGDGNFTAIIAPALQAMGSKFGSRKCSGTVDWGILIINVDNKGNFCWTADLVKLETQKATAIKI